MTQTSVAFANHVTTALYKIATCTCNILILTVTVVIFYDTLFRVVPFLPLMMNSGVLYGSFPVSKPSFQLTSYTVLTAAITTAQRALTRACTRHHWTRCECTLRPATACNWSAASRCRAEPNTKPRLSSIHGTSTLPASILTSSMSWIDTQAAS